MNVHRLQSTYDQNLIGFGFVWKDEGNDTWYYQMLSASGPLSPMFADLGELKAGDELSLGFDYDENCLAGGVYWKATVVRVNARTVTVRSQRSGELRRIEI